MNGHAPDSLPLQPRHRRRAAAGRTIAVALVLCAALAVPLALAARGGSSTAASPAAASDAGAEASPPGAGQGGDAPRLLEGEGALAGAEPATLAGPGGRVALTRWVLREDASARGNALGWAHGDFSGRAVGVPAALRGGAWSGRSGEANYRGSVAWYRTTLRCDAAGEYAIDFHSANFLAAVWVDGHPLGSHRGSYLPFEVRANLAAGEHQLVVRVDWRDPARQAREGFHRTWFNWGGLNGAVEARRVGLSELAQPMLSTTIERGTGRAPEALVKVTVLVRNDGPGRTLAPEGELARADRRFALSFPPLALEAGASATVTATAKIPEPALWSPASPDLYDLELHVGAESSYFARVGLRQLSWHGGRLYLNGSRLVLHGATVQEDVAGRGDALTGSDQAALVSELQAIHANAVRAQHPLDAGMLERLDAAGILVWQGVGPVEGAGQWYSDTPFLLARAEQQARTAVLAEELHPSVIAWNLVDEVAGNGRDGAEVSYVRSLTRWLHARDPGRMVAIDVWGDHPPRRAGSLYAEADAVAETDYSGWYDYPRDTPSQLAAAMRARLGTMERTFPGKVLAISEFGAESNSLNPSGAPGSFGYQARLLAAHIAVYRADPRLSGMLVWVLRDYPLNPRFQGGSIHFVLPHVRLIEGLNQKGLFTYSGRAKPAARTVARLFAAMG